MAGSTDAVELCKREVGEEEYAHIFLGPVAANFFAVGLPVVAVLGLVGNLMVLWVNHSRKLTGLSVTLLNASMLADMMLMTCLVLFYVPRGHLAKQFTVEDCASASPAFWRALGYAQRMYVVVHPLMDTSKCLVIWSATTYTLELYGVFFHPERVARITKAKSNAAKILVIICNTIVIMSLIHFFKFVLKDTQYHHVEHKIICLSDIYINDSYQRYDTYFYFGVVVLLPWVLMWPMLIRIITEIISRRRDPDLLRALPRIHVVLLVKEGRSTRNVFALSFLFLFCYAIVDGVDTYALSQTISDEVPCYLVPMDRRYSAIANGKILELLEVFFLLMYSASKFPVCYFSGKVFRRIFNANVSRTYHKLCRRTLARDETHSNLLPKRPTQQLNGSVPREHAATSPQEELKAAINNHHHHHRHPHHQHQHHHQSHKSSSEHTTRPHQPVHKAPVSQTNPVSRSPDLHMVYSHPPRVQRRFSFNSGSADLHASNSARMLRPWIRPTTLFEPQMFNSTKSTTPSRQWPEPSTAPKTRIASERATVTSSGSPDEQQREPCRPSNSQTVKPRNSSATTTKPPASRVLLPRPYVYAAPPRIFETHI